jgi:hypothetical protein
MIVKISTLPHFGLQYTPYNIAPHARFYKDIFHEM